MAEPSKRPRLDTAVTNDTVDDAWGDLGRFIEELPDELADGAFSAQIGFSDRSQDIATQSHQPSQLVSPTTLMPAHLQQWPQRQPPTNEHKMVQRQLVLLLHAHKCQRREVTNGVAPQPCQVRHCQTMINVLKHATNCQLGKACTVPHCVSSRRIIMHWKYCSRGDCSICQPLKNPCNRPGAVSSADTQTTGAAVHQSFQRQQQRPAMVHLDLTQVYAALGLPPPRQQQAVTNVSEQVPSASSSAFPLATPGIGASHLDIPMSATTSLSSGLGAQQQHTPTMTQQNLDIQHNLVLNTLGTLSGNAFTGEAPNHTVDDWRQSITPDLREHLVHKVVQAIFPSADSASSHDERILILVQYAREVERNKYEMANSREEYYHLLAEKIYNIQKDFRKKCDLRKQQGNDVLVQKMAILRKELHALQPQSGYCCIEVSREEIFEESYCCIMKTKPRILRKQLMVQFRAEEGVDYGGVAREWLYLLSHEMLNPCYGLFQYSRDDIYTLQINPDSGINPEHLSYFHFVGRIIGIAIFHGHYLDGAFTKPFYKQLLGKPITLDDLESVDPDLHRSLVWTLENDITGIIDHAFCVDHEAYGERIVHDLKPGGRDIPVTEENKKEYVKLYVNWRFMRGIEVQFLALQKGLNELISQHLLQPFDELELELVIGGLRKIDVEDWKENTCLEQCTTDSDIVKWFWRAVEEFDEERRARLLQFVTGNSRVPLQGFKALQGSTQSQETGLFTIYQVDTSTDSLPEAHTCFNCIDIPPYESYEKFLDKLTCAVEETCGFMSE